MSVFRQVPESTRHTGLLSGKLDPARHLLEGGATRTALRRLTGAQGASRRLRSGVGDFREAGLRRRAVLLAICHGFVMRWPTTLLRSSHKSLPILEIYFAHSFALWSEKCILHFAIRPLKGTVDRPDRPQSSGGDYAVFTGQRSQAKRRSDVRHFELCVP
jgi:hypothetical protein